MHLPVGVFFLLPLNKGVGTVAIEIAKSQIESHIRTEWGYQIFLSTVCLIYVPPSFLLLLLSLLLLLLVALVEISLTFFIVSVGISVQKNK